MAKRSAPPSANASGTRLKAAAMVRGASGSRIPTVLVVDGDRVSRRFVELALADDPDFVVEVVNDAQAALEILGTQVIDLIVSETVLPDMSGLQFYRKLSRESRLRGVPFVLLSADSRAHTKVQALRAGVDDYLCKPCDPSEFVARVSAILERQRRRRNEAKNKSYTLAGSFSTMPFPDLVSIVEVGQRSGILAVTTSDTSGRVFFDAGRVVHAEFGTLKGEEAFYRFLNDDEGQFEFTQGPCTLESTERTISLSTTALIMEGARRSDDARESRRHGPKQPSRRPKALSVRPDHSRVSATKPDVAAARHYELALRENFTLGDLRLLNETELAAFTKNDEAQHRLHLWLIAEREEGVSALLPLAGAPSERWLLDSLEPGPKLLGLSFHLRDERLLDVLLLDAATPAAFKSHLRRCPSVVVLAPPRGDIMALGTQARVALKSLLDEFAVAAVVGVGQPTLEEGLSRIGVVSTPSRLVCCLRGVLGDPSSDLRRLILHAIRFWLSSGAKVEPASGAMRA